MKVPREVRRYYEQLFINSFGLNYVLGKPTGKYRKKKVPRYFSLPLPTIRKYYDEDGDYVGLLFDIRWVRLLRLGNKTVEVPIYKRPRSKETVKFQRYTPLTRKEKE